MFQGAPGRLPGAGGMGLYHSFIYKELDDTVLSPLLCLTGGLSLKDFHVYGEDRPIITDKTISRTLPPWQAGGGGRGQGGQGPEKWGILRGGGKEPGWGARCSEKTLQIEGRAHTQASR